MKTRIKLKELASHVDLFSNEITLYIAFSVHGRCNYSKADELCKEELHRLFPPIVGPRIDVLGWGDHKCRTIRCSVKLLIADKAVYKHYDSWRG